MSLLRAAVAALLALAALLPTASWLPWLFVPLLAAAVARNHLTATLLAWLAAVALAPTVAPDIGMAPRVDHEIAAAGWAHFRAHWGALQWLGAAGLGLAAAALFRRLKPRQVATLALALWSLQLVATLFLFAPELFARAMRPPVAGTYAHDGALYRRTLDLMKTGLDYYSASQQAISQDQRHADPQAPPHRVLRTPLVYWVLGHLPGPPEVYALAYAATMVLAGLAAWRLAHRLGADPLLALLSPFLLTPLAVYGLASDSFLFVDFYASALGLVAAAVYVEGYRRSGLSLLWVCFLGREWMGAWLAAFLFDYFRERLPDRRTLGGMSAALLAAAGFMALHKQWSAGIIGPSVMHSYAEFLTFPGPEPVWASLRYGDLLALGGPLFAAAVGALGLRGLWSAEPGGRLGLLGTVALPMLLFTAAGHAGVPTPQGAIFPPDYWGLLIWPGLATGCALALARPPRISLQALLWAGLFLLVLTRGALLLLLLQSEPRGMQGNDFRGNYYNGARALQVGFLDLYNPPAFVQWQEQNGLQHSFDAWYPPLTYVVHAVFLSPDPLGSTRAYRLWNLAVIALIVVVNWHFARGRPWMLPPALLAAYLYSPTLDALFAGQVSLLLVLTTSLFCWLYLARRPLPACLFLALGISLKLTPAIFGVYFVVRRDWRACLYTAVGMLLWTLPVLVYTHTFALFPAWLARLPKVVEAWNVYVSQSLSSFVLKWFLPTDYWTPLVVLPPGAAHALAWVANMTVLVLTVCWFRRASPPRRMALEMATLLVAHLLILSRSWPHQHTYLLLAFPLVLYARTPRLWWAALLVLALGLVDGEAGQSVGEFTLRATLLKWHLPALLLLLLWAVLGQDLRADGGSADP